MKLAIKDIKGQSAGELEVKFELVDAYKGSQAVHDVVTAIRANQRQGTACAKTVGEVHGSNKKPWRQKGTGRARAGSHQSPLWVGGGVVFGPRPRSYRKTVTSSVRQLALRKSLTERIKLGDVIIVDDFKLSAPKTKEFSAVLDALGITGTALIVVDGTNKNLQLAARNLLTVDCATAQTLNTYDVLKSDKLVFTKSAFEQVEARLIKE